MRILLLLLCFIYSFAVFAQFTDAQKSTMNLENLYTNGGAETGKTGWSETGGGTLALESTIKREGKRSIKFTSSAVSDTLNFPAVVVMKGTNNCEASFYYRTTSAVFDAKVYINAVEVATLDLNAVTEFTKAIITFVCTDFINSTQVKITKGANTDIIYVDDDNYIGGNRNIGTTAQAEYVGGIKFGSDCTSFSTSSATFADMTDASCTTTVYGNVAAIAGVTAGATILNAKPGQYQVVVNGNFESDNITFIGAFRLYDGTNSWGDLRAYGTDLTRLDRGGFTANHAVTTGGNIDLKLQGLTGGSSIAVSPGTNHEMEISVYRFPSASEQVVRTDNSSLSGKALWEYRASGSASVISSATWETFNDSDLATRINTGIVTTPTIASDAAITVNNIPPGRYRVTAQGYYYAYNVSRCDFALYDGTTRVGNTAAFAALSTEIQTGSNVTGVFEYTSFQPSVTYKLQANQVTGTGDCFLEIDSSPEQLEITFEAISTDKPMTNTINSVSTSVNQVIVNSGSVDSACTSGTCTLTTGSEWVTSVTWASTGDYRLNIKSGVYNGTPQCFFQTNNQGDWATAIDSAFALSSTQYRFISHQTEAGGGSGAGNVRNTNFRFYCIGNK